MQAEIHRGRRLLCDADRIVVLTGAGLSADSGLATFRGSGGLWRNYRPEQLASPDAFARDPRLVWEWYGLRREKVAAATPNEAHRALARFALRRRGVLIITQNVDGLHTWAAAEAVVELGSGDPEAACNPVAQALPLDPADDGGSEPRGGRAGDEASTPESASNPVTRALPLELHGNLFRVRCTECSCCYPHGEPIDASAESSLPRCRGCGALLRPDIVWFGEPLGRAIEHAFAAAQRADLCLVVGTSAVVQPAASVATMTVRAGGAIIEVNPEPTLLTPSCAVSVRAGAAEAVPALVGDA